MKVILYKPTGKYRIIIPASLSETGKRQRLFFAKKEDAVAEARKREANRQAPSVSNQQHAALLLAQQLGISEHEILDAVKHYQKTVLSVVKRGATLEQACKAYLDHHEHEKSHLVTIRKYRSTLKRFSADLKGYGLPLVEVTKDQIINVYFKRFGPGVTRMTQWSNLRAFFNWAVENEYLATNPIGNIKPMDKWESNKEILSVEDFRRILVDCAANYPRLLPYFVLGGMAGVRRCEMISSTGVENDPRIEWSDIDFKNSKVWIRHEVAKETLAADRKRQIPLEPAAAEWLQSVAKTEGAVLEVSQSTLQRDKAELLDCLGLKVPENALRNSYASYAASFRGSGDVARAMGDLEVTIKRYYVDVGVDPELGRAWFNIWPGTKSNIISLAV